MAKGKTLFAAAIAAVSFAGFVGAAQAVVYVEPPGDAGQTLSTAAITGTPTPTEIDGTLSNINDADLYQLSITTAGSYTFSTNNDFTDLAGTDTELTLFTSTGAALLLNDDANGFVVSSSLTTSLATGTYYLGVAVTGNEPVNSASQLLFTQSNGDTTAVRGPASGVNPTALAGFDSNASYDGSGPYHITISAPAPVPEPTTWAVVGASGAALAFLRRRRAA